MNANLVHSVSARWARLGVLFNVEPVHSTLDVERLLLDTARVASANSRLVILPVTWLARYGEYVAKHRLTQLIHDELEPEYRPVLGLILDLAKHLGGKSNGSRFNIAIAACESASAARPLADVEYDNPSMSHLAERRASALSSKWGRWMEDFEPKDDALRPVEWIIAKNPSLAERALTGGDLLASIVAECETTESISSEIELARRCGASRPAVRDALRRLRLADRVRTSEQGRSMLISINPRRPI